MASGVVQPGGAGTTIFVYDDTHANAGGDGAYSMADIKLAMDALRPGQTDIEVQIGQGSGLQFSGARVQFLLNVSVMWGGQGSDGTMQTTWKDTNCDIFQRVGAQQYRAGGGPIATRLGTKLGALLAWPGENTVGGRDGISFFSNSGQTFRNDLYIYGCRIKVSGTLTWSQSGAVTQEVYGNTIECGGTNNVFGDGTTVGNYYNNIVILTANGNVINGMKSLDARGNQFVCQTPLQILALPTLQTTARISGMRLAGTPSVSDFRALPADCSDIYYIDVQHTDNAPRWSFSQNVSGSNPDKGVRQCARLNTKVVGGDGASLGDIPVRLYSSVLTDDGSAGSLFGLVLDTKTFGEGDLGFTHGTSGFTNGVRVRDHYMLANVYTVRDRYFTMLVNMPGGAYPVNPAYPSATVVFEWPGRNVYKGSYLKDGGSFTVCIMPIMLKAIVSTPITADTIPVEADGVERVVDLVPVMA